VAKTNKSTSRKILKRIDEKGFTMRCHDLRIHAIDHKRYRPQLDVGTKNFTYLHPIILLVVLTLATHAYAQQDPSSPPVSLGKNEKLVYQSTAKGDQVPDFSYAGYRSGEQPIPDVPVRVIVPVQKGDATLRIQSALDYVASLPLDKNGFRGTVLLEKGHHEISGSLTITSSGVVLRGGGMNGSGTVLTGTGQSRETLIRIAGKNNRENGKTCSLTDAYVPVNAKKIQVSSPHTFKAGDWVTIHRPSTKAWIQALGMEEFGGESGWLGWKPGERDLQWDRQITSVEGSSILLNAPLTTALDTTYGGGTIAVYHWPGRITNVGIENVVCRSAYDESNPKDEDHRWMAIIMENVRDAWVRQVTFEHFAGSAIALFETASCVTVEDCISHKPVSEIGGQRRYTFFTSGQQTLFQRIYSEYGYHDFATGFCAAGPNAFVQCESHLPYSFSGAVDSWASGVLFDIVNVDGQSLGFLNRRQDAQGAGWSAANSMLWQCTAARIDCYRPPTANNWAFGAWSQFAGDGHWSDPNNHIRPRSLYYAQLADRLEKEVSQRAHLLPMETEASSSPSVEQAGALTAKSKEPVLSLQDWIGRSSRRHPIPVDAPGVKTIDQLGYKKTITPTQTTPLKITNGWLVNKNTVVTGKRQDVAWWRGDIRPFEAQKANPHITRFVPGRTGTGLTDDLEQVTDQMKKNQVVALEHNYGLWYERRRDDHERVRRMDGEVWPPFYELPFARSGKGTAWDGLSKYDLTRYNTWYWARLRQFANLADEKGLVLVQQHYFQHNILEAGAHWADFPWRPANNINDTGFPEPPPYAGDKRIFMAEQFYDIDHPVRKQLHRAYIRKCLDNFIENSSVIHLISAEYTGPLHFVQFWLDVILEWEKETGKNALIGLSVTKDVQDSILADPVRNSAVDLIDIRYWHYRGDGTSYAPQGGKNLAPRQHARLVKPGRSPFEQVYRAVREYRLKYPGKAVVYSADGNDQNGWAVFMAGGSLANIPVTPYPEFTAAASAMQPVDFKDGFMLKDTKGFIVYSDGPESIKLDLTDSPGSFTVRWIDPRDGHSLKKEERIKGGVTITLKKPKAEVLVVWINKN
jgi:hypothetical protein